MANRSGSLDFIQTAKLNTGRKDENGQKRTEIKFMKKGKGMRERGEGRKKVGRKAKEK